jgi:hypothetical protein
MKSKFQEFKEWFHNEFYCGRKFDKKINPSFYINEIGDKLFEIEYKEEN